MEQARQATSYFNPRPREEGDVILAQTEDGLSEFQSTPS